MSTLKKQLISSNLNSAEYCEEKETLKIEFFKGDVYCYYQVPISTYLGLIEAESCGKFFNRNIRDIFEYKKVS